MKENYNSYERKFITEILLPRPEFQTTTSETEGDYVKERILFALQVAETLNHRRTALDVGCGSQLILANSLIELGFTVYSIDLITRKFDIFIRADAESLPFKNKVFQFVHSGSMFQYLWHPYIFIREAFRVLEDGGKFVLHATSSIDALQSGHNEKEVIEMMEEGGFKVLESKQSLGTIMVATK